MAALRSTTRLRSDDGAGQDWVPRAGDGTASPMSPKRQSIVCASLSNQVMAIRVGVVFGGETGDCLRAEFPSQMSLYFLIREKVSERPWRVLWGVHPMGLRRRIVCLGSLSGIEVGLFCQLLPQTLIFFAEAGRNLNRDPSQKIAALARTIRQPFAPQAQLMSLLRPARDF